MNLFSRIGNLYSTNSGQIDVITANDILRYKYLCEGAGLFIKDERDDSLFEGYHSYQPIELSEGWLFKLGFDCLNQDPGNHNQNIWLYKKNSKMKDFLVMEKNFHSRFEDWSEYAFFYKERKLEVEVNYLHDLQNFFDLFYGEIFQIENERIRENPYDGKFNPPITEEDDDLPF